MKKADNLKIIEDNLRISAQRPAPPVLKAITDPNLRLPAWAYGPFAVDPNMTFELEKQWKPAFEGDTWKCKAIFNPTLIEKDGDLYMFYRACPELESLDSRIGLAVYHGGKWEDFAENPIFYRQNEDENLGLEDPKIYRAEGRYFLFYNAICALPCPENEMPHTPYGDICVDIRVAVSDDLFHWEKLGRVVPESVSKHMVKGAVIPRNGKGEAVKIGDEYLMFLSVGCGGGLFVGRSKDMLHWTFEENRYIDMSKYGHIEEVACAVTEEEWDHFILDVYYTDLYYDQRGAQVLYQKSEPFRQSNICEGATFSWGGLMKYRGKRIFAQGWESPRDRARMYIYSEKSVERR